MSVPNDLHLFRLSFNQTLRLLIQERGITEITGMGDVMDILTEVSKLMGTGFEDDEISQFFVDCDVDATWTINRFVVHAARWFNGISAVRR